MNLIKKLKDKKEEKIDQLLNGCSDNLKIKLEDKVNINSLLVDLLNEKLKIAKLHFDNMQLDYDYIELSIITTHYLLYKAYKKKTNNYSLLVGTYNIDLNSSQTANIIVEELEEGGNYEK